MNRQTSIFLLIAVGVILASGGEAVSVSASPQDAKDPKPVLVDVVAAWSQDSIPVSGTNETPDNGRVFVIVFGKPRGLKNAGAFHVAARDGSGTVIGFRSLFNEGGILESREAVLRIPQATTTFR